MIVDWSLKAAVKFDEPDVSNLRKLFAAGREEPKSFFLNVETDRGEWAIVVVGPRDIRSPEFEKWVCYQLEEAVTAIKL